MESRNGDQGGHCQNKIGHTKYPRTSNIGFATCSATDLTFSWEGSMVSSSGGYGVLGWKTGASAGGLLPLGSRLLENGQSLEFPQQFHCLSASCRSHHSIHHRCNSFQWTSRLCSSKSRDVSKDGCYQQPCMIDWCRRWLACRRGNTVSICVEKTASNHSWLGHCGNRDCDRQRQILI